MNKLILTAFIVLTVSYITVPTVVGEPPIIEAPEIKPQVETKKRYVPTQAQDVWLSSLEWCESRGVPTAINKMDLDGTPSYGSFQFKPSTLKYYALKYEILSIENLDTNEEIMEKTMDRDIQRAIVIEMIGDPKTKWSTQFPDCTKNKIGLPPRY